MRFIYADPGLRNNLGHHANTCRLLTSELKRRCITPVVLTFEQIESPVKEEVAAIPHFRAFTYWTDDGDPICGWLSAFHTSADLLRQDLLRLGPLDPSDLIYFNSAQPAQLMGVAAWLSQFEAGSVPRVVMEFGTDPGVVPIDNQVANVADNRRVIYSIPEHGGAPRAMLWRFAAKYIPKQATDRLQLATFEQHTSTVYAGLINHPVGHLPLPQRALRPLRSRAGRRPVTVAVLGHQRGEKGYQFIPELAQGLLHASGDDIRLLVHNGAPEGMPDVQQTMRRLAAIDNRVVLDERTADLTMWLDLLDASDLIVCPYNPVRFHASYSGVAVEAVANGIPLVVPARTSLERLLLEKKGYGVAFDRWEAPSMLDATLKALGNFDQLAELAHVTAAAYPEMCGPERLVDALLGFAATK